MWVVETVLGVVECECKTHGTYLNLHRKGRVEGATSLVHKQVANLDHTSCVLLVSTLGHVQFQRFPTLCCRCGGTIDGGTRNNVSG